MRTLPVRPRIILGPPGTGKTTKLIGLVRESMARGVPPDRIGYITFTRRGAQEAKDRMSEEFGLKGRATLPWFSTIHSMCMRFMGLTSGSILEGDRLQEFASVVGERVTGRFSTDDGSYSGYDRGDRMLFMDNLARVRRITLRQQYEEAADNIDWPVVERFSRTLRQFKIDQHLVDYTDMLERFVEQGVGPHLDELFVDEVQDLSALQWDVVSVLCGGGVSRVVVAGDDDQAIYAWAGADVETMVDLDGDVEVLGQSYRVPRRVQAIADQVISRVSRRREKEWLPRDTDGVVRHVKDMQDVSFAGPSVMVLARNQYLLNNAMRELRASGTLFMHHGHPSVKPSLLAAIVAWERLRSGEPQPADQVARAVDLMTTGKGVVRGAKKNLSMMRDQTIDMATLEAMGVRTTRIWHEALDKIPPEERAYMVRCRRQGERFSIAPRVRVDTIHASKGGQADRVILLTDMAQRTYVESLDHPDDECRVWYVGCTRAREELTVVAPRSRMSFEV